MEEGGSKAKESRWPLDARIGKEWLFSSSSWKESSPADNLGICVCVRMCTRGQSCLTLSTSETVAHQVPLSMGFSRQEYWSVLSFPPPGDLPNPGIEPTSPVFLHWLVDSLPLSHLEILMTL